MAHFVGNVISEPMLAAQVLRVMQFDAGVQGTRR